MTVHSLKEGDYFYFFSPADPEHPFNGRRLKVDNTDERTGRVSFDNKIIDDYEWVNSICCWPERVELCKF